MSPILLIGPQACGKTLNAEQFMKLYGLKHCEDLYDKGSKTVLKEDTLYLYDELPKWVNPEVVEVKYFQHEIKKLANPHPLTPKI